MPNKNIVLGITGSIAAFKAAEIASSLVKSGVNVDVVMTENATKFITPLTMQVLSKNKVTTTMFDTTNEYNVEHISLASKADLVLVAPSTANIIAKINSGICDDMLTTTILATKAPVVFAPAMNVNMYLNEITIKNIKELKDRGFLFIDPIEGLLACGDYGIGNLAKVPNIVEFVLKQLGDTND